jgi:hypothetical protein
VGGLVAVGKAVAPSRASRWGGIVASRRSNKGNDGRLPHSSHIAFRSESLRIQVVYPPGGAPRTTLTLAEGSNWPQGGEIDIMEGINLQTTDQIALHTEGTG